MIASILLKRKFSKDFTDPSQLVEKTSTNLKFIVKLDPFK